VSLLRADVVTIFPALIEAFLDVGVVGRAVRRGVLDARVHDLRQVTDDPHRSVDDAPFGGGAGMVMMAEPMFRVVETVAPPRPLILLSPGGRRFDQAVATELAALDGFTLLCGRYEGVDDRVRTHLVDDELSLGDFVLAGGEVAAMAVVEAVARLVPGVLGNAASPAEESFRGGLLEYPQFTRPATLRGASVPEVLLSGDHGRVERWRLAQALVRTARQRPDLLVERGGVEDVEWAALDEFGLADDVRAALDPPPRPPVGSRGAGRLS